MRISGTTCPTAPPSWTSSLLGLSCCRPILEKATDYSGCLDCAAPEVVSQQLWALIGGLVKGDASAKRTFANVPQHNGFEAFRRIAETVNEDKALARKDLLSLVVHPKLATSKDNLQAALEVWDINKRLFESADGVLPAPDQQRLALIGLLPPDISEVWLRDFLVHQEVCPEAA